MHSRDDLFTESDLKPESEYSLCGIFRSLSGFGYGCLFAVNDVYLSIPREMSLIFDYINTLVFEDMVDFDYILDILGRIVEVNHWKVSRGQALERRFN